MLGFGGPPAHVALLRDLTVDAARGSTRASSRTRSPPAACCPAGEHAAGDLHRAAGGGPRGRARRRARVHPARADRGARDRGGRARRRAAGVGRGLRRGRRGGGRGRASSRPGSTLIDPRRGLPYVSRARVGGGALAGPSVVAVLLLCGRRPRLGRHTLQSDGLARADLARRQGRRALLRRRLRDHPADARRRVRRWMSDAGLRQRRRLRPDHARPGLHTVAFVGYAAAGLGGALVATAIAFAPCFAFVMLGARALRALRASRTPARSSTAPGPPRRARSSAPRSRSLGSFEHAWQWVVLAARPRRARCASRRSGCSSRRRRGPRHYALAMGLAEDLQDETAEVLAS